MRVHQDTWVLDSADNSLTEIKSNISKILHRSRVLSDHVKSLGCIKLCDKTSVCHFLKNDVSLWIKFVIQCDKAGCCSFRQFWFCLCVKGNVDLRFEVYYKCFETRKVN